MKKLNRILSLILCLVFTITSFAFVNTPVEAATTNLLTGFIYAVSTDTTESGAERKEIDDYYGRSCMYMKRAQSKNTFIDFNVDVDSIDSTKEIVLETSVIFSKYIYRINLQPNKSTMGRITMPEPNNVTETPILNEGEVNYEGWNDIKIVWKNVEGATAQVYFNDRIVAEFTVGAGHVLTSTDNAFRLSFDAPSKAKSFPEEIWLDVVNSKITQTVDNKVNFYDINEGLYEAQTVADGEKAIEIAAPSVDHYNFLGWYEKDATTVFDFDTALNNHVNLYAKYEAKTYDVVFKADGKEEAILSGKYGETVTGTIPEIPEKQGFSTVGWYIGDTDVEFTETTTITGPDMVINARYVQNNIPKYNVNFEVDGAIVKTEEVFEGHTVTMIENPTKEHYDFVGWTLNGADFDANTLIVSDITLVAKFEPKSYKVSIYTDDTLAELHKEDTIVYNTAYGELPVLSKAGHKFLGWKTTEGADFTAETVITKDTVVYAVWESTTKVLLDEDITQYTSLTGNKIEFLLPRADNTTAYFDEGLNFKISEAKPTERVFGNILVGRFRIPVGEYDSVNRTQVFNDRFVGDVRVDITFDASVSGKYTAEDGTSVTAPFGYISTGAYENGTFTPLLYNRLRNDRVESFNSSNTDESSFNALDDNKTGQLTKFNYPKGESAVLQIGYDTATLSAYMTMNDGDLRAWGEAGNPITYINGFHIQLMNAFKKGGNVKIKRVKVTQINDYMDDEAYKADYEKLNEKMALLPDSLVDDPNNATGVANLAEIDGVKWMSSNEEVLSSETGAITHTFVDNEVVVTAVVTSGIYVLAKEYSLTVKKDASVDIKDVLNQTFTTEEHLTNWDFVSLTDMQMAKYTVDDNGLKISKLTDAVNPNLNYETKRYFAYYDFYHQAAADDKYSTTEIKDLKGVYDITVDMSKYATSAVPMNIAIGYRNGNRFNSVGTLKINSAGTKFVTPKTAEMSESFDLPISDSAKITFRVDNINGQISVSADGVLLIDRYTYYNALGEDDRINSLKVELDNNNNIGDFITVKNITVTQVVKKELTELNNVMAAVSGIDVSRITDNPDSVSGNIKELPQSVDGYNISWKSLSNQINIDTREVFHDSTAKKVYVIAEIYDENAQYPLYVRRKFELNVRAALTTAELDKFKINSLGEITKQDYSDIRYDLDLPTVDGVVWTSSDTSIIGDDGKFVADAVVTKPTFVTIKATSNDEFKNYELTVSPRTGYSVVTEGSAPLAVKVGTVENAKISSNVITSFTYTANGETGKVNICDEKGNILVSMVAEADGIYFDYFGSNYKKYNVSNAKIDIMLMPDVDKAAIFVDGKIVADNVAFLNHADYVASVVSEINVGHITLSTDKYGLLQANIDNYDYFADAGKNYANSNGINLPSQTLTDAVVNWTSSNTDILKIDGTVNTPNIITNVNLGFKITDNQSDKIFIEKNFEIAVDCDSSKNIAHGIVPSVGFDDPDYPQSNATDDNINTIFRVVNSNIADFDIIFNLGEAKTFNSMFILQANTGIEEYEIYSSNDNSAWNKVSSGNMSGKLSSIVKFNNTNAQYIKLVVKKCNAKEIDIREIKVFVTGTALELAQYDFDSLVIDTAPTGTSISLPSKGANGTTFTWESSNTNVISTTGVITKPQSGTTVTLTAKAVVDGQTLAKPFDVYVDAYSANGPTQVGGGSGGGGGGGGSISSNEANKAPFIGANTDTPVHSDDTIIEDTTVNSGVYTDVNTTDWYSDAVITLTEKGIVSGDGTGKFNPYDNVTREQFVKMILEAIDVELTEGKHTFKDVVSGAWYEPYIATAVSKGIVNGLTDTEYGVGSNITRQDMAVLIERVLKVKEVEIAKTEVEPFADASTVSSYAAEAVANMKAIGLIQGYNNMYNPKDNLTRAEAATVIASLLELLAK